MSPKRIQFLQLLLFGGLGSGQLVCAGMTYHYGRAFHPLLASAAAFYVPLLSALAIGRRSWIDILVVGAVLVILAGLLDGLAFPVGTYGIIILHVAWSIGTIVSILRQPTKPNE